jgi:3-hydroxymyristoyl/3-hydroxydecanoyl-(acyl carrier protein) dehydratase
MIERYSLNILLTYVCVSIRPAYLRVYKNVSNNNWFIQVTNHFGVVFVHFRIVRHTCRSKKT